MDIQVQQSPTVAPMAMTPPFIRAPSLRNYKYHVYASYCVKDLPEVQTILHFLRSLGYKIFDPLKDFIPGERRLENMLNKGIDISKVTLVFLSKHFLASRLAMFEAESAILHAGRKKGKHQVISVMLKSCKIPRPLKSELCLYAWQYQQDEVKVHQRILYALQQPHPKVRRNNSRYFGRGMKPQQSQIQDDLAVANSWSLLLQLRKVKVILQHCNLSCINEGCSFTCAGLNYIRFHKHLKECRFQFLPCTNLECRQEIQKRRIGRHMKNCPFRKVRCHNEGCGKQLILGDLKVHEKMCPFRQETCPNRGCEQEFDFRDLERHLEICEYVLVPCELCHEAFTRCDIDSHWCPFSTQSCLVCSSQVLLKDLVSHQQDCHQTVTCDYPGCGLQLFKGNLTRHQLTCPCAQFRCPNEGCDYRGIQTSLVSHAMKCIYQRKQCPECGLLVADKDMKWHHRNCDKLVRCDLCGLQIPSSGKLTHDKWLCPQSNFVARCDVCGHCLLRNKFRDHRDSHTEEEINSSRLSSMTSETAVPDNSAKTTVPLTSKPRSKSEGDKDKGSNPVAIPKPANNNQTDIQQNIQLQAMLLGVQDVPDLPTGSARSCGIEDSWDFPIKITPASRKKLQNIDRFVEKNGRDFRQYFRN